MNIDEKIQNYLDNLTPAKKKTLIKKLNSGQLIKEVLRLKNYEVSEEWYLMHYDRFTEREHILVYLTNKNKYECFNGTKPEFEVYQLKGEELINKTFDRNMNKIIAKIAGISLKETEEIMNNTFLPLYKEAKRQVFAEMEEKE